MNFYLIVYDRKRGEMLELKQFGSGDRARALKARFDRESAEVENPDVEVVLLGASSRRALEKTHSRYFKSVQDIAQGMG